MADREFKEQVYRLFDADIDGMGHEQKVEYIERLVFEYQRDRDECRERPNSRKKWEDEELMVILNDAPTVENCVKYARIFKRGYGSIEQIYRWAAVPRRDMSERRANDAFILQIKRVAKQLGRRA